MLKNLSARFIMAVGFSLTYCLIMVACTKLVADKTINVETYVALIGAFALIVREIVNDYFERKDRTNGNGQPEVKPKEEAK
ncbi:hypothetical protein CCP1ISM_50014 [Azospirillaceae bacterium]